MDDCTITTLGYTFFIPKGFKTDGSSVPRIFWPGMSPWDEGERGPLVHDWLYRHGGYAHLVEADDPVGSPFNSFPVFTRADADNFYRDLMSQDGVASWRRFIAYVGVRLGGASSFRSSPSMVLNP